ncbi:MAG: LptA/OstA family protein [Nitrospinaceae bacterium]|jgi:lipopolysaccharide transport protein LptA|nr:LptA/OstA family protein [Nitrospinaceae bacterium]|tara:strand:- start:2467 stop:2982 length:516 start_codon:yes stop_codon:yes gene_type:complete
MLHLPNKAITYAGLFLAFTLLGAPPVLSQEGKKKEFSNKNRQEPIEITSDRMRSENGGQKIIFSGNVVIIQAGMAITADIMEVYNTPDKKQTEEIVAIGNVDIVRGEKRMKGDRAVYLYQLQKIILTGSPKAIAWEGKDTIEGREMIFLIEKDRFIVNERVRAKLFPKSSK